MRPRPGGYEGREEMKMAKIQFTTDELQTLVWALNSQLSQVRMRNIENGRPMMSETATRLSDMCGRAYMLLTKTLDEECENAAP